MTDKKRILLVASSLNTGGLEKCLVNFCNALNAEKYDVDLYLFNEGRALQKDLAPHIHILPEAPLYYTVYNRPILPALWTLCKKGRFDLMLYKLGRFFRTRLKKDLNTVSDFRWMQKTMLPIHTCYQVAIGFEEGTANYYVAHCVNANMKLGWVHTDIREINANPQLDKEAFAKLKAVCTVSQNSAEHLKQAYPEYADKVRVFRLPAMLPYKEIDAMAQAPCELPRDSINILSVGRIVELKGFHLCVEPLRRLVEEGYRVMWFIAGEGPDRAMLEAEIARLGMQDTFILLGNCPNPYAYMHKADICVQPSRYEGFSVAVWEEKYLRKPVVATTIPSNFEMLTDGINGMLVNRDADSIYTAVKYLLDKPAQRQAMGKAPANGFDQSLHILEDIEKLIEEAV